MRKLALLLIALFPLSLFAGHDVITITLRMEMW